MRAGGIVLVLGGARSGKSRRALEIAAPFATKSFVATAEAFDEEMAERIAHHRKERGGGWQTVECPLDIAGTLAGLPAGDDAVVVVDCLTLWLSNLMHAGADVEAEVSRLVDAAARCGPTVVFVSNEVGLGLVPETPLGRAFRDAQGRLNQRMAALADRVEFVAAGLPLTLKQEP